MPNKQVTDERVKNIMKDLPPQAYRPVPKMRNTIKQSFSGMKTLIGQIAEKKNIYKKTLQEKQQEHHRKLNSQKIFRIIIAIIAVLVLIGSGSFIVARLFF